MHLNIRYPINAQDIRKTRSLGGVQYPRNSMVMYPMYGYYVPDASYGGVFGYQTRTPILNDSDSSDDDIPLAQVKSRKSSKQSNKLKKISSNHKDRKSEIVRDGPRIRREKEIEKNDSDSKSINIPHQDEVYVDIVEESSEITLVDNNSTLEIEQGDDYAQNIILDEPQKKSRYFSHLRKLFKRL